MVGAEGSKFFLEINPSRLAKTSLFRLGFSKKNLSQNMSSLQRNNSLFHNA